jgi:hypothetical protein
MGRCLCRDGMIPHEFTCLLFEQHEDKKIMTCTFLLEPLIKLLFSGDNLVGVGLTLAALGKNTVKWQMCSAAVVFHILVPGSLVISSRILLSI